MARTITVNLNKKPVYNINIDHSFDGIKECFEELNYKNRRCMIITDSNVKQFYLDSFRETIKDSFKLVMDYIIEAGEKSKCFDNYYNIQKFLVENHFDRHDVLIALGGGVTGDLTGFIASTYMRGIDFIQVPTTLLADVDSSIGGKTAIDFEGYKNIVGAFYMPKLVYINVDTLSTLPEREFYAGMAEVMKYGLIMDSKFYEWLLEKMYEIHDKDPETIEEMIEHCCKCKQRIVEKDPYENGDRMLLNFGHTIGHAIEKEKEFELLHGECVSLGAVAAAHISWKKEKISSDEYYEIRDMFVPFNLPITIDNITPEDILKSVKHDKKSDGDMTKFVLLKKVGKAYVDTTVTDEEILNAINEIYFSDEDMRA